MGSGIITRDAFDCREAGSLFQCEHHLRKKGPHDNWHGIDCVVVVLGIIVIECVAFSSKGRFDLLDGELVCSTVSWSANGNSSSKSNGCRTN